MSAPLVTTSVTLPGLPGAAAPAKGAVASALAGFEQLLGALQGQTDPGVPAVAAKSATVSAIVTAEQPQAGEETDPATLGGELVADDVLVPDLALPLAIAPPPPFAAPVQAAAAAPEGEAVRAFGHGGARGGPIAPPLASPDPAPEVTDKPEVSLDDGGVSAPASHDRPGVTRYAKAETAAPQATPRPAPQAAAAAPIAPTSNVQPDAGADVAPVVAPEARPAEVPTAAAPVLAAPTPALSGLATPGPPPIRGAQATRSERARETVDGAAPAIAPAAAAARKAAAPPAAFETAAAPTPEAETAEPALVAGKDSGAPDTGAIAAETAAPATGSQVAHAIHNLVRGAPETVANLAAQIVKKLEGKSTRFDLQLDPAGLGKVDVRIEIGAQGQLSAAMSFDSPQAAAELKSRANELHRALEQAGFDLTGGLSFDVAGDRGQSRQGWDQANSDSNNGRAFRGQAFQQALATAGEALDTALSGAIRLRRGLAAGVDVRI